MERHLAKVERNNAVDGVAKQPIIKQKPAVAEAEPVKEKVPGPDTTAAAAAEAGVENRENNENEKNPAASEVVKELEAKTFSCSECGMKTHSRMTYIQHVLNGCIMDMVLGEVREQIILFRNYFYIQCTCRDLKKYNRPKNCQIFRMASE